MVLESKKRIRQTRKVNEIREDFETLYPSQKQYYKRIIKCWKRKALIASIRVTLKNPASV